MVKWSCGSIKTSRIALRELDLEHHHCPLPERGGLGRNSPPAKTPVTTRASLRLSTWGRQQSQLASWIYSPAPSRTISHVVIGSPSTVDESLRMPCFPDACWNASAKASFWRFASSTSGNHCSPSGRGRSAVGNSRTPPYGLPLVARSNTHRACTTRGMISSRSSGPRNVAPTSSAARPMAMNFHLIVVTLELDTTRYDRPFREPQIATCWEEG